MVLALALLLASAPVPSRRIDWNEVIAALQLVSDEYDETLDLADPDAARQRRRQLAALLGRAAGPLPSGEIRAQIDAILVRLTETDYGIIDRCAAAIRTILERVRVRRTPRVKPDLERGRRLYSRACAPCHGADGTGNTALAKTMDPPPRDILHPRRNWTPYEMFNRITYGGAETAMPAFKEGLSERDRWDIVFHLFAERWPPCARPVPQLRADELALLGDFELSNRFAYGAAACLRRDFLPPAGAAARGQ